MNLRDLRYLVAVADTRHFGKAAERCHVSQPTLSAQIKKLEGYLGVELIERNPRGVVLTEVGAELVTRARRVLRDSDEIVNLARDFRDPLAGKLAMASIPTIGPYLLPVVARKLRKQLPHLQLMLYEYQTDALLRRLRDGEIDLGILALPVDLEGLEVKELYREDFVMALPANHELAKKPSVKLSDLSGEDLLLLEDGHCLRDQALEACSRVDVNENQDYRATSLETLRQMVASGWGVTLLPKFATSGPFAAGAGIVVKAFPRPAPHRLVGAVWRKSSTRILAIKAICEIVGTTVKAKAE
ncbi:MAG: LysR family transcriptional regulator [Candidatus Obscuribacterales bacterium]|nr:LysR family transcriptional regulator [Steroidobacteraceae bacterium]